MTTSEPRHLQLIYVHGFNGDHTTFQSFPLDLQSHLAERISKIPNMKVTSTIYPTYKSVKPISHAARNFLEWLTTQPPGPVILLGHSMGGLLVAEAAIDPSNNPETWPGAKPKRIVGMIAFDCPYLGMHPHVVKTGIASLFAGDEGKETETDLNQHPHVKIEDERVADDWEAFKRQLDAESMRSVNTFRTANTHLSPSPNPSSTSSLSNHTSSSSSSSKLSKALNFFSSHADDPMVRWIRKHSDEPFGAGKRWIVEHFQFGSCMFDPSGLKNRYTKLVAWQSGNGLWVNYWTQTPDRERTVKGHEGDEETAKEHKAEEQVVENDVALIESGMANLPSPGAAATTPSSPTSPASPSGGKKSASKEKKLKEIQGKSGIKPGRHFVVLPTGLGQVFGGGDKWEKVMIHGVDDEVKAHCGLFIRGQNLEYDALVERVGKRVLGWAAKV
ncbi:hypothetical protein DL96DRAFT_1586123 [Flagelloscypha sp. PMI_526]|nr:hypothetical protein DL96DRAFT_1586123 [Flagelloscypha sp. PMI_526]